MKPLDNINCGDNIRMGFLTEHWAQGFLNRVKAEIENWFHLAGHQGKNSAAVAAGQSDAVVVFLRKSLRPSR